jgi:hypothetical protein
VFPKFLYGFMGAHEGQVGNPKDISH